MYVSKDLHQRKTFFSFYNKVYTNISLFLKVAKLIRGKIMTLTKVRSIVALGLIGYLITPPLGMCFDLPLEIKRMILKYSSENQDTSYYNGQAGPLYITPETASKAGLKVYVDEHLHNARSFKQDALKYRKLALSNLDGVSKGEKPESAVQDILGYVLLYKKYLYDSKYEYSAYKDNLNKSRQTDERFNSNLLLSAIDYVFRESLDISMRLRDALGIFYNRIRGLDEEDSINKHNIEFVNYFFDIFVKQYPSIIKNHGTMIEKANMPFDQAKSSEIMKNYVSDKRILDAIVSSSSTLNPKVDPLIFFTLVRRESNLNQYAVSPMAAVGLTQIIPATARHLGMKGVYEPEYLKTCISLLKEANAKRDRAYEILFSVTTLNDERLVFDAIETMKESIELRRRHSELLKRYKRELMERGNDERLQIEASIFYGMKYFYQQLEAFDYDLSLALSAYNAGPGRVKEYKGIPPFSETIKYRNWIISNYYKLKYSNSAQTVP